MSFSSVLKALTSRLGFQSSSVSGISGPFFGQNFSLWDSFWSGKPQTIDYAKELGDLRCSALLMAAHTWLSSSLAAARLTVVELDADNKENEIANHPLVELFENPNPYYGSEELLSGIALSWLVMSTAYMIKVRGAAGQTVQLWYEPWWSIRPAWPDDGSAFINRYQVERNGYWQDIPIEDVLVLRKGIDPETRMGQSATSSLLREYYTDRQAAEFGALLMKQGLVPPVVISLGDKDSPVSPEQAVAFKQELVRKFSGSNAAEPLVTSAPADVQTLAYDYSKVGLRDVRALPEERFCSAMGISPYSLHFGTSRGASTFSNVEQYLRYDYRAYVVPFQKYIAKRLARELLPEFDTATNHQVRWNYDDVELMQSDMTAEWNRIIAAFKARVLDQGEARDGLGYAFDDSHKGVYYPVPAASTSEQEPEGTAPQPAIALPQQEPMSAAAAAKGVIDPGLISSTDDGIAWWRKRAPAAAKGLIDASSSEPS